MISSRRPSSDDIPLLMGGGLPPASPASSRYYKGIARSGSTSSRAKLEEVKRKKPTLAKRILARLGRMKKVFSRKKANSKPTKPSFKAPYEFKTPGSRHSSRSSMRSHRSSMRMIKRRSAPSILLTHPTYRGRNMSYQLHDYGGTASPPNDEQPKTMRFTHPAVNGVIAPLQTPMTMRSGFTLMTAGTADDLNWPLVSPVAVQTASGSPVDPKKIWEESNTRMSFPEFKDKLDAHQVISDGRKKCRTTAPELPYIGRTATLRFAVENIVDKPSKASLRDINKQREATLALLEGPKPSIKISHPAALVPGNDGTRRGLKDRHTVATTDGSCIAKDPSMPKYTAWNPTFNKHLDIFENSYFSSNVSSTEVKLAKVPGLKSGRPTTPASFATVRKHRKHYDNVESGLFKRTNDSVPSVCEEGLAELKQTSSGESRAAATVNSSCSSVIATLGGASMLKNHTPPQASAASSTMGFMRKRKPVPNISPKSPTPSAKVDKPLPEIPALGSPRRISQVPTPHQMNDSGFPVLTYAPFVAEPLYQRRSVNEVEAKFKRDQKAKDSKAEKEVSAQKATDGPFPSKGNAMESKEAKKLAKKIAKEQAKVDTLVARQNAISKSHKQVPGPATGPEFEQKVKKANQIDRELRRLCL